MSCLRRSGGGHHAATSMWRIGHERVRSPACVAARSPADICGGCTGSTREAPTFPSYDCNPFDRPTPARPSSVVASFSTCQSQNTTFAPARCRRLLIALWPRPSAASFRCDWKSATASAEPKSNSTSHRSVALSRGRPGDAAVAGARGIDEADGVMLCDDHVRPAHCRGVESAVGVGPHRSGIGSAAVPGADRWPQKLHARATQGAACTALTRMTCARTAAGKTTPRCARCRRSRRDAATASAGPSICHPWGHTPVQDVRPMPSSTSPARSATATSPATATCARRATC